MSRELLIETTPTGLRAALMREGRLIEVAIEDEADAGIRDHVFLGRVRAVDDRIGAAFVDCGLGEPAFLGARHARALTAASRDAPLSRRLSEGQAVVVQGLSEAAGGKGPRVTADIALAGMFLLLRPRRRDVEVAARLMRTRDGAEQRARAARLFPEGGVLLRTAAPLATDSELRTEAARLLALWQDIEQRAGASAPPASLHADGDALERILLQQLEPGLDRVLVGDRAAFARVRNLAARWLPRLEGRIEHVPEPFAERGADEQLAAALEPVVALDGGGSLVIEPTAALTAIDVNGAGREALETNLEAAGEIARQLRLRRIGGTVVIDFIDLAARRDRARVLDALREALADDPAPVQVHPMTALGLVSLSRRRDGPDLAARLRRTCPLCAGTGTIPRLARRAEAIMRALAADPAPRRRVRTAPDLYHYLEGEGMPAWRRFAERQGTRPRLVADPSLAPGAFVIEREIS